jgi:hypothetical protein
LFLGIATAHSGAELREYGPLLTWGIGLLLAGAILAALVSGEMGQWGWKGGSAKFSRADGAVSEDRPTREPSIVTILRLFIVLAAVAFAVVFVLKVGGTFLPGSKETAEKTPPVVPKSVRTITITATGARCPEGYQVVTRRDDGQTACAKDIVPITK